MDIDLRPSSPFYFDTKLISYKLEVLALQIQFLYPTIYPSGRWTVSVKLIPNVDAAAYWSGSI